jgi:hypothetical protein
MNFWWHCNTWDWGEFQNKGRFIVSHDKNGVCAFGFGGLT